MTLFRDCQAYDSANNLKKNNPTSKFFRLTWYAL
jgi:hypothetical protein